MRDFIVKEIIGNIWRSDKEILGFHINHLKY